MNISKALKDIRDKDRKRIYKDLPEFYRCRRDSPAIKFCPNCENLLIYKDGQLYCRFCDKYMENK